MIMVVSSNSFMRFFRNFLFKFHRSRDYWFYIENNMCNSSSLEIDICNILGLSQISLHCLVNCVDIQHISKNILEE